MKNIKFSTTENVQEYVNFINDLDLGDKLDNFETGYQNGSFFIDIEGKEELITCIKKLDKKYIKTKFR